MEGAYIKAALQNRTEMVSEVCVSDDTDIYATCYESGFWHDPEMYNLKEKARPY